MLQELRRLECQDNLQCLGCGYEHGCSLHGCAIIKQAAERLEQLTVPMPNPPLTLEELREMDGEPVYIKSVFGRMYAIVEVSYRRVYLHTVNNKKMCNYEFLAWEKAGGFKVYRRRSEGECQAPSDQTVPSWAEHLQARFLRTE